MNLSLDRFDNDAYCYEFIAQFIDLNNDLIPNSMSLKFYPKSGKIILCTQSNKKKKEIVYGCLFKNNVLTEIDIIKKKQKKPSSQVQSDTA